MYPGGEPASRHLAIVEVVGSRIKGVKPEEEPPDASCAVAQCLKARTLVAEASRPGDRLIRRPTAWSCGGDVAHLMDEHLGGSLGHLEVMPLVGDSGQFCECQPDPSCTMQQPEVRRGRAARFD